MKTATHTRPLYDRLGRCFVAAAMLLLFGVTAAQAQDLKVVASGAATINIDESATITVTASDADGVGFGSAELRVELESSLSLTGASTACAGCTFTKLNDTAAKLTFSSLNAAKSITFDVEGAAVDAGALVEVTTTSLSADEDGTAVEPNQATVSMTVTSPDLAIAFTAPASPQQYATDAAATATVTITNNGNASATDIRATISVPGLDINLVTGITGGGECTLGTNCSFDPVSGVLLHSGDVANGESISLTLSGTIDNIDFAGAWTAQINDVDPTDADDSDNTARVGVTVNDAPVWQALQSGPFDGTVTDIALSSGSVNVFAAADGRGIFHSNDAGANWCEDLTSSPSLGSFVKAVAVSSTNIVAAAFGDDGGVYVSIDGGRNFAAATTQPKNSGVDDKKGMTLLALSGVADNVILGTEDGLYRSTNGGVAWSTNKASFSGADARFTALAEDGGGPAEVLAGADNGQLWRSTDSGATFTQLGTHTLSGFAIHDLTYNSSTSKWYAATSDGVYMTTSPVGLTWTKLSFGTGVQTPFMRSIVAFSDGSDYIVAGGDGGQVFISSNDGASWTLSGFGFPSLTVYSLAHIEDGGTHYVYAGTGNQGLFVSTNFGESWIQSQLQLPNMQVNAVSFDYMNGDPLAGTYGYGVYRHDASCGWQPAGGQPATLNPITGAEVENDNGLGNPWIMSLVVSDPNTYFAGTWNGGIYRSINEGDDWNQSGLPNLAVYDLGRFEDGLGNEFILAGADRGEVYRSIDDGITWAKFALGNAPVYAIAGIASSNPRTYLAGTFGRGIYKSIDDGATWTQTSLADAFVYDIVEFKGDAYAATATGLYKSTDDGDTWSKVTDADVAGKDIRTLAALGATEMFASVWGGGVLESTDGSAWGASDLALVHESIRMFTTRMVQEDAQLVAEVYAISDKGQVYLQRRRAGGELGAPVPVEGEMDLPSAIGLSQNYPNPFNPVTTIRFDLPEASPVRLAVYDVLGRQVKVLVDGVAAAGSHQVRFEASNLPSGTYFYRLATPAKTMTQQMVLIK